MAEPIKITVQGVLEDLKKGYTRTISDRQYKGEKMSIEEKYGLNKSQVKDLFDHPKLKGKKTIAIKVPAFILIDEEDGSDSDIDKSTETPSITSTTSIEESSEAIDENVSEEEHAAESTSDEDPSWMA
jgi:hypothetical protein